MDSYQVISADHDILDTDADGEDAGDDIGREPPPVGVGQDERRMQVRAYNHWASLLGSRNFPRIEDLISGKTPDFADNAVVLDFSNSSENPAVTMLGRKLADECGATTAIACLSDVPGRSLLSRITDQYMHISANQAPVGFQAEFVNLRGKTVVYRGILLPFSSDGEKIRHIMGVINWKELADPAMSAGLIRELDNVAAANQSRSSLSLGEWADGPATAECGNARGVGSDHVGRAGWGMDGWAAAARELPTLAWENIDVTGGEFAMLLVQRMPDGPCRLLGEVHGDADLMEWAGRQLLR